MMARIVSLNLWWMRKRLPSSIMGIRCPKPGLDSRTRCAGLCKSMMNLELRKPSDYWRIYKLCFF